MLYVLTPKLLPSHSSNVGNKECNHGIHTQTHDIENEDLQISKINKPIPRVWNDKENIMKIICILIAYEDTIRET